MGMNTYELWYYIMVAAFAVAGIFLALTIIVFLREHIPSVFAVLNGRAQKKDIEKIRAEMARGDDERFHYFEKDGRHAANRSVTKSVAERIPAAQDSLETETLLPDDQSTGVLLSDDQPTGVLLSDDQPTSVLSSDDPVTDVLSGEFRQRTPVEPQADPGATGRAQRFRVVSDETVVHAEDIIGDG
jgi:hypothetical protein